MKPIRQTQELIEELERFGDSKTAAGLARMAALAREIVPEVVGLSLALVEENLTFTLVASSDVIAELDAVQYLDGGPCVDAADRGVPIQASNTDPLDEQTWRMYAEATAAAGISSTLSLPILDEDRVIGGINLYASTAAAFDGHIEELGEALGASAEDAVSNADLEFSTRLAGEAATTRLAELDEINVAVGVIVAAQHVDPDTALDRLRQAAARAGITDHEAARAIANFLRADR